MATLGDGNSNTVNGAFEAIAGAKKCKKSDGPPDAANVTLHENIEDLAACKAKAEASKENLAFQYETAA